MELIHQQHPYTIKILKQLLSTWPVLLNRAPTLHRMNVQAFKIRLVQGKAILLHPLVCGSFNADFDGDQMGVHIPISQQSRAEAWNLLWSVNNSMAIATRDPLFVPSQDIVIGNYLLTEPSSEFSFLFELENKKENISHIPQVWDKAMLRNYFNKDDLTSPLTMHAKTNQNGFAKVNYANRSYYKLFPKPLLIFSSLEEASTYYLNFSTQLSINDSLWFGCFSSFEIPEREKPIEFFIDSKGKTVFTSNYYEMHFKNQRVQKNLKLGINENQVLTNDTILRGTPIKKNSLVSAKISTHEKSAALKPMDSKKNLKSNLPRFLVKSPKNDLKKKTFFAVPSSEKPKAFMLSKGSLMSPICTKQMLRSTFGRIEFYLQTTLESSSSP